MLTLWDLIEPLKRKVVEAFAPSKPPTPRYKLPHRRQRHSENTSPAAASPAATPPTATRTATELDSMEARYDRITHEMLARYNVRVRKWRKSMSGVAWQVIYRDGRRVNLIESPKPKGPMSVAVFLHEIGHHAIGLGAFKPRCLEEYHAWKFAIEQMEAHGLNITDAVRTRMRKSLEYAVGKASRRGIKAIPVELHTYIPPSARSRFDYK